MSSHKRVLQRLLSIRIYYKILICAVAGCLYRQISICAAVGGTRIWRNDQISNSSSYTLGSIWKEMLIICFPLWRSSCFWSVTTYFDVHSKSYRDTHWGKIFLKRKIEGELSISQDAVAEKTLTVQKKKKQQQQQQQEAMIQRLSRQINFFGDITQPLKPISLNQNSTLTLPFHSLLLFEY